MEASPVDQSSSVLDPKHGAAINGSLKTESSPRADGLDLTAGEKSPFPVSSSPDSPLSDPLRNVDHPSPKNDSVCQSGIVLGQEPVPGDFIPPKDDVSNPGLDKNLAMESPPSQVMERTSTYDPNRIPASVFDRSKSSNPMEWSTASNESLFSIHMGTMSFTKDQSFFRPEELNLPGEVSTSGQMFNFSPSQSLAYDTAERKSDELRTETAVETMKEVIRESEGQKNEKPVPRGQVAHISRESGTSTKSFAFPVLTGDADRGSSVKIAGSPRADPDQQPPETKPESAASTEPESKAAEANQQAPSAKWFPCFSCCC